MTAEPPARRVLVVEDEPLIRALVLSLLQNGGFEARGVSGAAEAITALPEFDPDALLVDLDLGDGPGGVEVLTYADQVMPGIALVVLTNAPSPGVLGVDPQLIPARAAYLHKRSLGEASLVLDTIGEVLADQRPRRDDTTPTGPLSGLSPDQLEVLRLIASGYSNAEIGARRGTSTHGVEQVVQRLIARLGVARGPGTNPRVQLAKLYYAHGPHPQ
jgi:DNA-binding NarL/FixJ family response regulator